MWGAFARGVNASTTNRVVSGLALIVFTLSTLRVIEYVSPLTLVANLTDPYEQLMQLLLGWLEPALRWIIDLLAKPTGIEMPLLPIWKHIAILYIRVFYAAALRPGTPPGLVARAPPVLIGVLIGVAGGAWFSSSALLLAQLQATPASIVPTTNDVGQMHQFVAFFAVGVLVPLLAPALFDAFASVWIAAIKIDWRGWGSLVSGLVQLVIALVASYLRAVLLFAISSLGVLIIVEPILWITGWVLNFLHIAQGDFIGLTDLHDSAAFNAFAAICAISGIAGYAILTSLETFRAILASLALSGAIYLAGLGLHHFGIG